jgi:hypothetical protein
VHDYTDKELAELLRLLKPAPGHLVEAAKQIPRVKRQIEEVLPHIGGLSDNRELETAELKKAIEAAGLSPEPELVAELQRRLSRE